MQTASSCASRHPGDVVLPTAVNSDKSKATYRDGILRIELPKAEGVKPRVFSVSVK